MDLEQAKQEIQQLKDKLQKQTEEFFSYKEETKEYEELLQQEINSKEENIEQLQKQLKQQQAQSQVVNSGDNQEKLAQQLITELDQWKNKCQELEIELEFEKEENSNKGKGESQKDNELNKNKIRELENEILNKTTEQTSLMNKIKDLNQELDQLNKNMESLIEINKNSQIQIDTLQLSLEDQKQHLSIYEQQIQKYQNQVQQQSVQLEEQQVKLNQYTMNQQQEQENIKLQLDQTNIELISLKQELKQKELDKENLQKQLLESQEQLGLFEKHNNELKENNQQLLIQLQNKQQDNQSNDEIKNLKDKIFKLESQLSLNTDQQKQVQTLKKQNQKLSEDFQGQIDSLEQENIELKRQLTDEQVKSSRMMKESQNKENEFLQRQQSSEQVKDEEIDDLKNYIELIQQEKDQLQSQLNQLVDEYNNAKESSDQIVTQSTIIINQLNKELGQLQEQVKDLEILEEQISNQEESINLLNQRNQLLEEELIIEKDKQKDQIQKLQEYENELKEIVHKHNYVNQKANQLEEQNIQLKEKNEELLQILQQIQLKKENEETQPLQTMQIELHQIKSQLEQEKSKSQRDNYQRNEEIQKLKKQLNQWENILTYLDNNKQFQEDNLYLLETVNEIRRIQQEKVSINNQMTHLLLENEELQNQISQFDSILEKKELQIDDLTSKLDGMKHKSVRKSLLLNEQDINEELRQELSLLNSKYENLLLIKQRNSEILSERKQSINEDVIQLQQENEYLKEEINKLTNQRIRSKRQSMDHRQSRLLLDVNGLQVQVQFLQSQLDEKEQIIQNLREIIQTKSRQSIDSGKGSKVTLRDLINSRQNSQSELALDYEKLKQENQDLRYCLERIEQLDYENKLNQMKGQIIQYQIKVEALNSMALENLKLKKKIAQLEVQVAKEKSQDNYNNQQPYSPLKPMQVMNHLRQKSLKKQEYTISSDIKHCQEKLVQDNKNTLTQSKQLIVLQKIIEENQQKIFAQNNQLNQLHSLLDSVIVDIKNKSSLMISEDVTKKKQLINFLSKITSQIDYIKRKINVQNKRSGDSPKKYQSLQQMQSNSYN